MIDDLEKLRADMEEFRRAALAFAGMSPNSQVSASRAWSEVRAPLSGGYMATAAVLAERAMRLADGIASLKDRAVL